MTYLSTIEMKLDESETILFQNLAQMFIDGERPQWLARELGNLIQQKVSWKITGSYLYNFNMNLSISQYEIAKALQKIPRGQSGFVYAFTAKRGRHDTNEVENEAAPEVTESTEAEYDHNCHHLTVIGNDLKNISRDLKKIVELLTPKEPEAIEIKSTPELEEKLDKFVKARRASRKPNYLGIADAYVQVNPIEFDPFRNVEHMRIQDEILEAHAKARAIVDRQYGLTDD